jgi:hypothetical protein
MRGTETENHQTQTRVSDEKEGRQTAAARAARSNGKEERRKEEK